MKAMTATFTPSSANRRRTGIWLACMALALTGGCLSRPSYVRQSFSFAFPPITNLTTTTPPRVLEVRRLDLAAPFDSQSLVYRTGEFSYEHDPYAQFLVRPGESLLGPIRGMLINSGLFSDVVQSGSDLKPDATADISVDQLYGDFRDRAKPLAVLDLRFVLFDVRSGSPGKVVFQKAYHEQVPLQARTAAALMAGWNQALDEILAKLVSDLKRQG